MAYARTLITTAATLLTVVGCTSHSVGTQASLARGDLQTTGLADQRLVVQWQDGSAIHASGPGGSDYINLDSGTFDAHSTYPEATSVVELPDGTRLVANDTGDVEIDEVTLQGADGSIQTVRGFRRTMSAQINAEADRLAIAASMATAMSTDQAKAFVDYMDAADAWAETFTNVANAARAMFLARFGE
ncbi:MAG: hypothetical protein AAGB34_08770 [Planctomycetota bacterium]